MDKNISKSITDYLNKIDRPDNLQGISSNLIDYCKKDIQAELSNLVEENIVIEKIINKAKIYYVNQKQLKVKIINTNLLDTLIKEKRDQSKEIENTIREKENKLKIENEKIRKKKDLLEEIERYENENLEYENKIKKIEDNKKKNKIKEEQYKKYSYEQVSRECLKRKLIAKEIVDALSEFENKKRKTVLEDIGIEFYK